jgi:hypothetical protein
MLPLILELENADFRPPTHVSSGCQWLVASWNRGPQAEIPNSRSPDSRFGRESGRESPIPDSAKIGNRPGGIPGPDSRESPIPDSAGIGKQGLPVSRFGRDRESGSRWRRAGDFKFLVSGCQCFRVGRVLINLT